MSRFHPQVASDGGDGGFSLVEVLVALSVIAVMSGLMISVTGQLRQLLQAEQEMVQKAALQAAARHMSGLLARAERKAFLRDDGAWDIYLEGTPTSVSFVTVARRGAFNHSLGEVLFESQGTGDAMRVVEVIKPRRASASEGDIETIELTTGAARVAFSYLGKPDTENTAAVWQDAWQIPGALPKAIRVTLTTNQSLVATAVASLDLAQ